MGKHLVRRSPSSLAYGKTHARRHHWCDESHKLVVVFIRCTQHIAKYIKAPQLSTDTRKRAGSTTTTRLLHNLTMASPKGTILITGGTGKVGSCIAKLCQTSSTPYLVASRGASSATASTVHPTVKFDWMDRTTWSNPFITATKTSPITAVYLVSPPVFDASAIMNDFIDLARKEHGVKRFVLQYALPQPQNPTSFGGLPPSRRAWQRSAATVEQAGPKPTANTPPPGAPPRSRRAGPSSAGPRSTCKSSARRRPGSGSG